jgi:hypothetical protein
MLIDLGLVEGDLDGRRRQKHMTDIYNLGPVNKEVAPAEALVKVLPTPGRWRS